MAPRVLPFQPKKQTPVLVPPTPPAGGLQITVGQITVTVVRPEKKA